MTNPLFSIITICYNSEKTLERTVLSVLAQTCKDYEYIIVDGASKDNTLDIIKRYEPMFDGRMKWKSEPDKGIYDAMNKGVRMASGDIIGIVNSDDWLESDALDIVNNIFIESERDTDALYCGGINFHSMDGTVRRRCVNLKSFKWQTSLYIMSGIRHPATFVPRQVYERIGLYNDQMKFSADQDFVLRCYYGGVRFIEIPEVLSNMSEGGLSTEGSERAKRLSTEDRKLMLHNFNKRGLEYYWLFYTWKLRGLVKKLVRLRF